MKAGPIVRSATHPVSMGACTSLWRWDWDAKVAGIEGDRKGVPLPSWLSGASASL